MPFLCPFRFLRALRRPAYPQAVSARLKPMSETDRQINARLREERAARRPTATTYAERAFEGEPCQHCSAREEFQRLERKRRLMREAQNARYHRRINRDSWQMDSRGRN